MISGVILTHNSHSVEKTLQSLSWCDEIIVIDDFSSDDTVSKVKKYTDKIFERHLNDDFAMQRNFGLKKAKYPWIFFVDSDEIVSDELKNEIIQKIENTDVQGFYVKRRDFMWGRELKHGETGNIKLLRLGKKDSGEWERPVHEVWNIQGNVNSLQSPLRHYPHPDVSQFLNEINRYSSINAEYNISQGKRVTVFEIGAYPLGKFIVNYFFKLGFLDGTAGIIMALMMSLHSFLTRGKMWELQRKGIVAYEKK